MDNSVDNVDNSHNLAKFTPYICLRYYMYTNTYNNLTRRFAACFAAQVNCAATFKN